MQPDTVMAKQFEAITRSTIWPLLHELGNASPEGDYGWCAT